VTGVRCRKNPPSTFQTLDVIDQYGSTEKSILDTPIPLFNRVSSRFPGSRFLAQSQTYGHRPVKTPGDTGWGRADDAKKPVRPPWNGTGPALPSQSKWMSHAVLCAVACSRARHRCTLDRRGLDRTCVHPLRRDPFRDTSGCVVLVGATPVVARAGARVDPGCAVAEIPHACRGPGYSHSTRSCLINLERYVGSMPNRCAAADLFPPHVEMVSLISCLLYPSTASWYGRLSPEISKGSGKPAGSSS